jgi:hypothetical protein
MQEILAWMEASTLGRFVLGNALVFPTLETLHFLGLILLIGSLYVMDLRVLGLARDISLTAVLRFIPVSIVGFCINLGTGIMFLFADPTRYYPNLSFRIKMLSVLLAGLNALWFKFVMQSHLAAEPEPRDAPTIAKWIAGISMVLWTSVIVFGRLIPYVE